MYALIIMTALNSYGVGHWEVMEEGFDSIPQCEFYMHQHRKDFKNYIINGAVNYNCDEVKGSVE